MFRLHHQLFRTLCYVFKTENEEIDPEQLIEYIKIGIKRPMEDSETPSLVRQF